MSTEIEVVDIKDWPEIDKAITERNIDRSTIRYVRGSVRQGQPCIVVVLFGGAEIELTEITGKLTYWRQQDVFSE